MIHKEIKTKTGIAKKRERGSKGERGGFVLVFVLSTQCPLQPDRLF